MKTSSVKPTDITKKWYVVDAKDKVLGRLATQIAHTLRGKHKPSFVPHLDCGDNIIVVNAESIKVTSNKEETKSYYHHTGYVGGIKSRTVAEMREKSPETIIEKAVKGMLPKNKLSRQVMKNLRIFVGPEHTHTAQNPEPLPLSRLSK